MAIAATAVIWTCIMGFIFLREKLHWVDFAMIPGNVGEFQTLFREIQKFLFFSDKF